MVDKLGGLTEAINLAKENGYFHTNQYHNQDNPKAHYLSTGPEIWADTDGQLSHFVAGIGTGGTMSGTAKFLKEKNPKIRTIAVDPEGSLFADYIRGNKLPKPAAYKVEGIGTDCLTEALYPNVIDEVITARDEDSFEVARLLARDEGLSVGGSSGAAVWAAREIAPELDEKALIVVLIPDSGTRYLTKCFNDAWMTKHGFSTKKRSSKLEV